MSQIQKPLPQTKLPRAYQLPLRLIMSACLLKPMVLPLYTAGLFMLHPALCLLFALLRDPTSLPWSPLLLWKTPRQQDPNQVMHISEIIILLHRSRAQLPKVMGEEILVFIKKLKCLDLFDKKSSSSDFAEILQIKIAGYYFLVVYCCNVIIPAQIQTVPCFCVL